MKTIYYRVSTDGQDFMQQKEVVTKYLQKIGETTELFTVSEKISGSVKHTERKLNELLNFVCGRYKGLYPLIFPNKTVTSF